MPAARRQRQDRCGPSDSARASSDAPRHAASLSRRGFRSPAGAAACLSNFECERRGARRRSAPGLRRSHRRGVQGWECERATLIVGRCTLCSLPWHRSGSHQARETSRAHSTHRRPHAPPPAKPPRARSTCSRPHPRGSQACTLPCGHLFGLSCIVAELRRRRETPRERRERSECPICRQGAVEQQVRPWSSPWPAGASRRAGLHALGLLGGAVR